MRTIPSWATQIGKHGSTTLGIQIVMCFNDKSASLIDVEVSAECSIVIPLFAARIILRALFVNLSEALVSVSLRRCVYMWACNTEPRARDR